MQYVTREESGLVAPTSISRISASLGIYVHWTAGPIDQTPREIQRFHMGPDRGWTDIAYSWLVRTDGTIFEGRGWGRAGAHTAGYNSTSHAVCAIAGDDRQITNAMQNALEIVIEEHDRLYGVGYHRPHRAVGSTACPGDKLAEWITNWTGEPGMAEQEIIDAVAGFEHDTRKLILQGQVEAERNHAQAMRAEWKTRRMVLDAIGELDTSEVEGDEKKSVAKSDLLVTEGERQLAELDVVPVK